MKTQKTLIGIMWIAIAIQNSFFLNYKIAGLEISDIAILFGSLALIFLYPKTYKIRNYAFWSILYLIILASLSLGFAEASVTNILRDFRNFIFLILSFMIFSQTKISSAYMKKLFVWGGVFNSVTYILFSDSVIDRNLSVVLWVSVISCMIIMLDKDRKPKYYYLIAIFNIVIVMLSQTRTLIIPILFVGLVLIGSYLKRLEVKKIVFATSAIIVMVYAMQQFGIYDMILRRFASENMFGSYSTLNLRWDSIFLNFSDFSIFNWLFGTGFGKEIQYYRNFWGDDMIATGTDLEMFIPNYIMKIGLISFFAMLMFIASMLWRCNRKNKTDFHKLMYIITVGVLSGGIISGLVGPEASVILGVLFGLASNKDIS